MTNAERFETILKDQYTQLFEADPAYKGHIARRTEPADLAKKMTEGLLAGTANKDGNGIKRTCRALGVKYTYQSISQYLNQGV